MEDEKPWMGLLNEICRERGITPLDLIQKFLYMEYREKEDKEAMEIIRKAAAIIKQTAK